MRKGKILLTVILVTLLSLGVMSTEKDKKTFKNKKLVVALDTSYYNYFLQKGHPTGYQIEILDLFAKHEGVDIDFCMVPDSLKLSMLKEKKIDIAVFSEGLDSLYNVFTEHEKICASIPLDEHAKSVWISHEDNMDLILSVNVWASKLKAKNIYSFLQTKYFKRSYNKNTSQISTYDNMLKKYSEQIGWDWRLIAALVYQESMFRSDVVSKHGATGLMQLMPQTAKRFGVQNIYNPEENIRGGIKLLEYLTNYFDKKGVSKEENINFVLAAYNAGHGRIDNCMKIADVLGLDQYKWHDVNSAIPLMRNPNPEISAIMLGSRFNGKETMNFVESVLKRYQHYQHFFETE